MNWKKIETILKGIFKEKKATIEQIKTLVECCLDRGIFEGEFCNYAYQDARESCKVCKKARGENSEVPLYPKVCWNCQLGKCSTCEHQSVRVAQMKEHAEVNEYPFTE